MPKVAVLNRFFDVVTTSWRGLPPSARFLSLAGAIGVGVLCSVSSLGFFSARTTLAPPSPPAASPWWVTHAAAVDDTACQLSLRVADEKGYAIDDARLHVVSLKDGAVVQRRSVLTSGGGYARLIDLQPGFYDVTVDVDGHALNGVPTFRCDPQVGGQRAFFDVEVAPATGLLTGILVGHRGAALAGATVTLWQHDTERTGLSGVVRVTTDAEGRFRAPLRQGRYRVQAVAADHVARETTVTVEAETTTRLALRFRPTLQGVVVDEGGAPIAGAVVSVGGVFDPKARGTAVVADNQGRFVLPVALGQAVTITARGDGRLARADLGVIDDPRQRRAIVLRATRGRVVVGTVVTTSGAPHGYGGVRYRARSVGLEGEAPTDAHGRFVIDGMPPEVDVEVWAADHESGAWGAQVATPGRGELTLLTTVPSPPCGSLQGCSAVSRR
jgi:hypothetical protein